MIKLYGSDAENIQEGDLFRAEIDSVEGRKVVKLISTSIELEGAEEPEERREPPDWNDLD